MFAWYVATALAVEPTFPTAGGFGGTVTGGRGGPVLKVTTLAASGPGSLQAAVDAPGPRIVVFDVSGVIEGDVHIDHGDLTVAGQTAPGAGITIAGHLTATYDETWGNLVLQHLRIRPPPVSAEWPAAQHDAVQLSTHRGVLLDHLDLSHGVDELLDLWGGAKEVTVQWSVFADPAFDGGHPDGPEHNYALINGPGGGHISVHHNLFAHARARTPAIAEGPAEVLGNVVYNGREGFVHHNPASGDFQIVGNSYLAGPSAVLLPFWFDPENPDPSVQYYVADNAVDDPGVYTGIVGNPWRDDAFLATYGFFCCGISPGHFVDTAFDWSAEEDRAPLPLPEPSKALDDVLACAGAWPRDAVTRRVVAEVRSRSGAWGQPRPDLMHGLTAGSASKDADSDGMADDWERAHGLDPGDGTDHSQMLNPPYTAIEVYLHAKSTELVPCLDPEEAPDSLSPDDGTTTDSTSIEGCRCNSGQANGVPAWMAAVLMLWRRRRGGPTGSR